jgi:hypothetical protein
MGGKAGGSLTLDRQPPREGIVAEFDSAAYITAK